MIENERQYETTKLQLTRLEASLETARAQLAARVEIPDAVRQGHLNGVQMLIDDLRAELDEYEKTRPQLMKSAA